MSAAQMSKLEALECHFTWSLDPRGFKLFRLRDKLEDIGTEEGNSWLGHVHNLQGFVQYKLESMENAQSLFNKAAEAFCQLRNADEGPWLVVNYGNLAWLHHHLGDEAESETYLSKVDALMNKYPSPSQGELHPEICAEKAWTLMEFTAEKKLLAADYYQRAIRMQPDMVEWNTSYVLGIRKYYTYSSKGEEAVKAVEALIPEMRIAKERDPENLYLAVVYLEERAKKGEQIQDEACVLARKVLRNPVSSYSGINPLLCLYRNFLSVDEAINLAEKALRNHPDERFLKKCAALCYKMKIIWRGHKSPGQRVIERAITLYKELISLYPQACRMTKIDLANIYGKSSDSQAKAKADQIYQELLESDLEPADKQMLYNQYAKYLFGVKHDHQRSTEYHMKAAEIQHQSVFRDYSIKFLEKSMERSRNPMRRKIEEFLKILHIQ